MVNGRSYLKGKKCPYQPYPQNRKVLKKETGIIEELVNCPYYKIERVKIKGRMEFIQTKTFYAVNVIKGEGVIDKYQIVEGDNFIIPYDYGKYEIQGHIELIISSVPTLH